MVGDAAARMPERAAEFPPLPDPGECHVWAATAPELGPLQEYLLSLLGPAEQARAARYRHPLAGQLFVASRAVQRVLAGRYLGRCPADVTIERRCPHCGDEKHGRPRVAGADGGLEFSVSHTGELLLLAYVSHGLVGIDAERADRRPGLDRLVGATLTPAEAAVVTAASEPDQCAVFCRLWTRKEAVLKLTGHGLTVPLRTVDVTADTVAATGVADGWPATPIRLTDLRLEAGEYIAAIATTLPARRVTVRPATPYLVPPSS